VPLRLDGSLSTSGIARRYHGNPVSRNHPCMQPPTGTVTLKEFSGKYSPDLHRPPKKGREGLGARIRKDLL